MSAVNIRDIPNRIDIQDSCNGCCRCFFNCCVQPDTVIYINKENEGEIFDYDKSDNYEADFIKSVKRLKKHLEKLSLILDSSDLFIFEQRQVVLFKDIKDINKKLLNLHKNFSEHQNLFTI